MYRKKLLLGIAAGFLLLGTLIGYVSHERSLSAALTITAVPAVSHIRINGQGAKQGVNKVRPGSKEIEVTMPGFSPVVQTISVQKGDKKAVSIVLSSNSSQTANWYFTHPADEKTAEGLSSRANDAISKQLAQTSPLIKLLPFVAGGLAFRVDYGNQPGTNAGLPLIFITAQTPQTQQAGLDWIKSLGYDLSDYKIKLISAAVQPLNP